MVPICSSLRGDESLNHHHFKLLRSGIICFCSRTQPTLTGTGEKHPFCPKPPYDTWLDKTLRSPGRGHWVKLPCDSCHSSCCLPHGTRGAQTWPVFKFLHSPAPAHLTTFSAILHWETWPQAIPAPCLPWLPARSVSALAGSIWNTFRLPRARRHSRTTPLGPSFLPDSTAPAVALAHPGVDCL